MIQIHPLCTKPFHHFLKIRIGPVKLEGQLYNFGQYRECSWINFVFVTVVPINACFHKVGYATNIKVKIIHSYARWSDGLYNCMCELKWGGNSPIICKTYIRVQFCIPSHIRITIIMKTLFMTYMIKMSYKANKGHII